jgi:hypothetical protein
MKRAAQLVLLIALLCPLAYTQDTLSRPPENMPQGLPPITTFKDLDEFLAKPLSDRDKCESRVFQWQEWYGQNMPVIERLQTDLAVLRDSKRELRIDIFLGSLAIGSGCAFAWVIMRAFRRWWPVSKQRRQLITLLLVATWVTVTVGVTTGSPALAHHPVNLAISVLIYSLPALLFGGVGVWWFGRTSEILR